MDQTTTTPRGTETPLRPKPLSFTNGVLKRHSPKPLYKECLRNHAATLGGHALDGCGEFMPSPLSSPFDPTSLKCAACGCHRNFHRRDDDPENDDNPTSQFTPKRRNSDSPSPLASSAPHMLLALSAGHTVPAHEENNNSTHPETPNAVSGTMGRKRFRTKFSKEQKEKMYEFSERLGWKMQKQDECAVDEFCREIGVGKGVFKVWMHNNKHTLMKRDGDITRDVVVMMAAMNRNTSTTSHIDTNCNDNNNNNNHSGNSNTHLMNGSSSSS